MDIAVELGWLAVSVVVVVVFGGGIVLTHSDTFHTGVPLRATGLSQVTSISFSSRDLF